ncbi:uncharacterized protein METZ01_LOCUS416185 [marine metagenome]|uniref:Uncharacterized protein n=1 Tax=marine metagenome TaxID=408172 RepID=A0A382WZC4_9ZZZZ
MQDNALRSFINELITTGWYPIPVALPVPQISGRAPVTRIGEDQLLDVSDQISPD